ncbi:MAG: glycoside hydrolase [Ruminococcaceae bacterium]|nr:glycoside hydrolase [Oscillospiraceae bacterium]
MKRIRFGTPEKHVPSAYCPGFHYEESPISYDISRISFRKNARGVLVTLPLGADEHIYGLGLQLTQFDHKGKKMTLRVNADPKMPTGDTHAPVPFLVSTRGYGIYLDTARYAEVYCGVVPAGSDLKTSEYKLFTSEAELYAPKELDGESQLAIQIPAASGIDLYLMEGNTITDVVAKYNLLSGGGCDVPEWGLGVFYRCFLRYTDKQVLEMADYFRKNDIPCSILGLEPGWQTHAYSCTYVWDEERYQDLSGMLQKLKEQDFHLSLWEHAFTHPTSPLYSEMAKGSGDYKVWEGLVPDFSLPEIRTAFAKYHKDHVMHGVVDGFKLDECDSSDMTGGWSFPLFTEFPGGMDGEQYHSLFGTLYMQTMLEALEGTPTLSEVRNAGALAASYPFVLYSDLYDHREFVRAMVNSGFSGLLWTPEVRHAGSKEEMLRRLQTVVFSPQCLINAWYCEEAPWKALDCEDEVRELLKLRMTLVPMLQEAFANYKARGIAPIRALVSDFTDDPETYTIDDQYLFCDKLLVAPIFTGETGRKVYLPTGAKWRDYFTKEPVESGWLEISTTSIPVYERD